MGTPAFNHSFSPFMIDDDDEGEVLSHQSALRVRPWLQLLQVVLLSLVSGSFLLGALIASARDPLFSQPALSSGGSDELWGGALVGIHRVSGLFALFLALASAVVVLRRDPRGWVRWLGITIAALLMVQTFGRSWIAAGPFSVLILLHPFLAQVVVAFCVVQLFAHSPKIIRRCSGGFQLIPSSWFAPSVCLIGLCVVQMLSGTAVRLFDASLAIPDFPMMGGSLAPWFNEVRLDNINLLRAENGLAPVGAAQVILHLVHRIGTVLFAVAAALLAWKLHAHAEGTGPLSRRASTAVVVGVLLQIAIGAALLWSLLDPLALVLHFVVSTVILASAMVLSVRLRFQL